MKSCLVLGSSGFIGRHMVRELVSRGYQVLGHDIAHHVSPVDVLDFFKGEVAKHRFDLTVHAAYHVGGRAAIDGTNTNFAKNVQLDSALFEWAVRTKQKRVLYFSSSAAYPVELQTKEAYDYAFSEDWGDEGNREMGWREYAMPLKEGLIDLHDPREPDANYGYAKLVGERLAEDARRNGLQVSVVRPLSGYGEDQDLDYPFPSIVARARQGNLEVWGPPGQTRDWIHVDDVISGSLAVVESETEDPVNLCTGIATEMGNLAKLVQTLYRHGRKVMGWDKFKVDYLEDKPYGAFYRVGDPTRMLQYYTPKVSLEEGIRRALR